jgi:hypothetical protein
VIEVEPEPVSDLPEFTFKKVSVSGQRFATPSEDKE